MKVVTTEFVMYYVKDRLHHLQRERPVAIRVDAKMALDVSKAELARFSSGE